MITLTATDTLKITESRNLGIYNFGSDNLYPQHTTILADNSSALKRCLETYGDFVFGRGVSENDGFWKAKANIRGMRTDQLLRQITSEYVKHNGFALHFQFNAMFEKTGVQVIPFDRLRIPKRDDEQNVTTIMYHKDWAASRIRKEDIVEYNLYNPDKEVMARQAALAGGFEKWRGQIYYYGANGEVAYPHNTFHSVIEDVVTDIKLKKGKNANASTNFMASHFLQVPWLFKEQTPYREADPNGDRFKKEFIESLKNFQGCENLGKLGVLESKMTDKEGKPIYYKFDKLDVQNYDVLFKETEASVKDNIRGIYKIPQILLEAVATGFSTEIMTDMYNYYNNVTYNDRLIMEETLMLIFEGWYYDINPSKNYTISKLQFI